MLVNIYTFLIIKGIEAQSNLDDFFFPFFVEGKVLFP